MTRNMEQNGPGVLMASRSSLNVGNGQLRTTLASAANQILNAPTYLQQTIVQAADMWKTAQAIQPDDIVIALMGATGAGKTSFISLMTDEELVIGHSITSCTTVVGIHKCRPRSDRRTVWLVDTPGFDDTYRSDTDILTEIAEWLVTAYENQIFLTGIIYLHPISETRMKSSTMKNLRMFKKLVGPEGLARVILATTFWSKVSEEEGLDRESQLTSNDDFWGIMVRKGSEVYRHFGSVESATEIIDSLIHHHRLDTRKVTLAIQQEVVNEGKKLSETSAGRSLEDEMERQRQKFDADIQALREEIAEANREKDREYEERLKKKELEIQEMYANADPDKLRVHVKKGICNVM